MSLPAVVTKNVIRQGLKFKKQSPHIFFATGIVGAVASTVMACRATLKLSSTLDDIHNDVKNVKAKKQLIHHDSKIIDAPNYSEAQADRDILVVYTKASLQIVKLYGPSVIVGVASIGLLTKSHVELSKRNTALMAAYAAVQEAYDNYRERVRKQLGDERELELYHAVETEIVKGEKKEIKSADPSRWSPYARMFDEYNKNWQQDPELNRLFITCQQNYLNQILRTRGHLFLNEVYDAFGFERSRAGAVVGWVIGDEGDNYIDFGLSEAYNARFFNGVEPSIILDFNVDGVIYDKI